MPILPELGHQGEVDGDQAWLSETGIGASRSKADVNGSYGNPQGAAPDPVGISRSRTGDLRGGLSLHPIGASQVSLA